MSQKKVIWFICGYLIPNMRRMQATRNTRFYLVNQLLSVIGTQEMQNLVKGHLLLRNSEVSSYTIKFLFQKVCMMAVAKKC